MSPACVVFLGPPGTGKGTQAHRMQTRLGLAVLASGDLLRAEIQNGSSLGKRADGYLTRGELVPDELVTELMLDRIGRVAAPRGCLLDGFPRTVPQALALDRWLTDGGRTLQAVIDFRLADEAIVARLSGRRVCGVCGESYNTRFRPPAQPNVCDRCGSELVQRVDDEAAVIQKRLETYRRQTAPLVSFYAERGVLTAIDAGAAPEVVEEDVVAIIAAAQGGA